MKRPGTLLAAKILAEIKELSQLVNRAKHGWEKATLKHDDYYLDGVALNLHGFYSGLERIFERVQPLTGMFLTAPTGIRSC